MSIRTQTKKSSAKEKDGGLRPEYDLSELRGGVRGKYYGKAIGGTDLVLVKSDIADIIPMAKSVNLHRRTKTKR